MLDSGSLSSATVSTSSVKVIKCPLKKPGIKDYRAFGASSWARTKDLRINSPTL